MRASCDRIDIDKQKTISQTLRFPYNARVYTVYCIIYTIQYTVYTRALYGNLKVYIMRASYDSIDNKLKQKMCGKVNKDITFIQFFHSTPLHFTPLNYSKYSSRC